MNIDELRLMFVSFFLAKIVSDLSGLYTPGPGVCRVLACTNRFSVDPNTPCLPQGFFCTASTIKFIVEFLFIT
jgi:hypothetical protein